MRRLWEDHITWTRLFIVSAAHDLTDKQATTERANPRHWGCAEMRRMMREHLDLTLAEAVAHLENKHRADIRAYDRIHRQILHMADMLSGGITAQFRERFR